MNDFGYQPDDNAGWFIRLIRRLISRWRANVEENEPIADFMREDLGTLDSTFHNMLKNIGDIGSALNLLNFKIGQLDNHIAEVEQDMDEAAESQKSTDAFAINLARLKATRQHLKNVYDKLFEAQENSNILLQDQDQRAEDVEARYIELTIRDEVANIQNASNSSIAAITGLYRTQNALHLGKVEERVVRKEGKVEAQQQAITGVLAARGKSVATKKRVLNPAAQAELEASRQRIAARKVAQEPNNQQASSAADGK